MRPDMGKVNPRADSFSLYCNWVANRILMNILPKNSLDSRLQKILRNSRKRAIENNPKNNNNNLNSPPKKGAKASPSKPKGSPSKPTKALASDEKKPAPAAVKQSPDSTTKKIEAV